MGDEKPEQITIHSPEPYVVIKEPLLIVYPDITWGFIEDLSDAKDESVSDKEIVLRCLTPLVDEASVGDGYERLASLDDSKLTSILSQFGERYAAVVSRALENNKDPYGPFVAEVEKEFGEQSAELRAALNSLIVSFMPKIDWGAIFSTANVLGGRAVEAMQTFSKAAAPIIESATKLIPMQASYDASELGFYLPLRAAGHDEIDWNDGENSIAALFIREDAALLNERISVVRGSLPGFQLVHFDEAVEAYRKGLNAPACYSLVTFFETMLVEKGLIEESGNPKVFTKLKEINDGNAPLTFDVLNVSLVITALIAVFMHVDFGKADALVALNRHVVTHGRSHRIFSSIDCIKLISVLSGLCELDADVMAGIASGTLMDEEEL